jgi:hypothetical protein
MSSWRSILQFIVRVNEQEPSCGSETEATFLLLHFADSMFRSRISLALFVFRHRHSIVSMFPMTYDEFPALFEAVNGNELIPMGSLEFGTFPMDVIPP